MKYLFTYSYKGVDQGMPVTGEGSINITLHGSGRITPKAIESSCDLVRQDLNLKGIEIDTLAPMGWFKYDEEESEEK